MMKFFSVLSAAVILISCGAKKGGTSKDAKADFQLNQAATDSLGDADDATRAKYENKTIEMKGYVKEPHKSVSAASPNKYSFYLCANATDESGTICYTDEDPAALAGKAVTVKGKFDYAGVITLDDCVVY